MVGGPACEWVPKDGSAVGGLATAMGGCVGCGGSVGGNGCVCVCVCVCVCLVIYKVVLLNVGLCWWWLSALL